MIALHGQQDLLNARTYHHPGVEKHYLDRSLNRMETVTLLRHQPAYAHKDVLDIGVGTGRTSVYLASLASHYEGIDYSPVMLRVMHSTLPEISARLADMRHLAGFADASFDFIFAPNNVLDAVGHDDRLLTLSEFWRVLRPGGTLAFSSHNLDFAQAVKGPRMRWKLHDPFKQIYFAGHWLVQMVNHLRTRAMRSIQPTYALLTDEGHDYALLHYYIGQSEQREQLSELHFDIAEVLDDNGQSLAAGIRASSSSSLMYVASRPTG